MSQVTRYAALSPTNQFVFACPIFNVDVKMRQCVALTEGAKVSKKVEVRKGCQACIRAGKCPVDVMSRMIAFNSPGIEPDEYGAATPIKGKLGPNLLRRIAPVIVPERTLNDFAVPQIERDLIASSHQKMMAALPAYQAADEAAVSAPKRKRASKSKAVDATPAPTPTRINKAAETGDMAAAL